MIEHKFEAPKGYNELLFRVTEKCIWVNEFDHASIALDLDTDLTRFIIWESDYDKDGYYHLKISGNQTYRITGYVKVGEFNSFIKEIKEFKSRNKNMLKSKVNKIESVALEFDNHVGERHSYGIDVKHDSVVVLHTYEPDSFSSKRVVNSMSKDQFKEYVSYLVEVAESL